ncbi:sensor histidine kinase [Streptomyces sp. KLOTTS4A1]|uniref:sensor histidine kinase n=1 Tax=Streptomyces sp. KLOTTS4A1 TaxID=3390996 RepID=UPI0039F4F380
MKRSPQRHSRLCPRPRSAFAFLPWLLLGMGSLSHVVKGETPNPWVGAVGLLAFNSLYVYVVFRAFTPAARTSPYTRAALAVMAAVTFALAIGYGGPWLAFFPLLSLAVGTNLRGRRLAWTVGLLTVLAAATAARQDADPSSAVTTGYGTLLSGMVTAALLALWEKVVELRETREELARTAVDQERLRFSRDLHDLLGHTLSLIVVKSEAARRLAPHDTEASLRQVADIENVGRQALTEIREAVTGYRASSLTTELDRARDALASAGFEAVVRRSGPPPSPVTGAVLAWVLREAVTNVVRHSGATNCRIELVGSAEEVRLSVTDNGRGEGARTPGVGSSLPGEPGVGLHGLSERLAQAGGSLQAGPAEHGGFRVEARLAAHLPVRTA